MKPSTLKPGMRVLLTPSLGNTAARSATVIKRHPAGCGRKAITVVNVDDFRGLNGPCDQGTVHLSDYEVSRLLAPLEVRS